MTLHPTCCPWALGLQLSSGLGLQWLPELCSNCACIQLGHSHVRACHGADPDLQTDFPAGPGTCLVVAGPDPDLWTDFPAWPWTCLPATALLGHLDPPAHVATVPRLSLCLPGAAWGSAGCPAACVPHTVPSLRELQAAAPRL